MGYTIKLSKEHPKAGMLKEIVERRETVRDPGLLNSLHDSIMFFEYTAVELRLIDQGPENSYNELATRPFPLHDVSLRIYCLNRPHFKMRLSESFSKKSYSGSELLKKKPFLTINFLLEFCQFAGV